MDICFAFFDNVFVGTCHLSPSVPSGADNPTYLKFPGDKAVVMLGVAGCSIAVGPRDLSWNPLANCTLTLPFLSLRIYSGPLTHEGLLQHGVSISSCLNHTSSQSHPHSLASSYEHTGQHGTDTTSHPPLVLAVVPSLRWLASQCHVFACFSHGTGKYEV